MFIVTLLQVLDFSSHFFYKTGKYSVQIDCPVKSFPQWAHLNEKIKYNETHIVIPPKTPKEGAPCGKMQLKPNGKSANYVNITLPESGEHNSLSFCYTDIVSPKGTAFKFGAKVEHGKSNIILLNRPIVNEEVYVRIYLYNKHQTQEAVYLKPIVNFVEPEVLTMESTSEKVENHEGMTIETCHVTSEHGKIALNTIPLKNAFDLPVQIRYPNLEFEDPLEGYASIPLVANGTHIAAFNILQEKYMHVWHYAKTKDYTSFEMSMVARNSTGADISYILWEVNTTSWKDAVEHFHEAFPEIYHVQPFWGLWATFPRLNETFPDNNDELDVYHVGFQWAAEVWNMKTTVPNWCYVEPSHIHVRIPYNKDTFMEDMKKCEYPPEMVEPERREMHKLKCRTVLSSAARRADGSLYINGENDPWNENGMEIYPYFDDDAQHFFDVRVNRSYFYPVKWGYQEFVGIALDSFRSKRCTYIDRKNGYTPGKFIPYFLVDDDGREVLPILTGLFQSVKHYMSYSPKGVMINGEHMMPELVKYASNIGVEVGFYDEKCRGIHDAWWILNRLWGSRYTAGSRSMSCVENTNRELSFDSKEEYFSIMASFGSASSYFSHDASNNIFFRNRTDVELLKPFMKRWMPVLEEAFCGNIFYANELGLVKTEMPKEKQVPELDISDAISSTTLWCQPKEKAKNGYVNCYLVAFLGHDKPHNNGTNFHREMHITIDGKDPECMFMAEGMKCNANGDGTVDVSMHGTQPYKTYKSSFIRFKRNVSSNYPDYSKEVIINSKNKTTFIYVGVSLAAVVIVVVCIAVFICKKKKQQEFQSEALNEEIIV